jgi:hypothetical protein
MIDLSAGRVGPMSRESSDDSRAAYPMAIHRLVDEGMPLVGP